MQIVTIATWTGYIRVRTWFAGSKTKFITGSAKFFLNDLGQVT